MLPDRVVARRVRAGPPDFVGVGAQRAGTTWWFLRLLDHPDIRPPSPRRKEQHYFDQFCARPMTDADVEEYHRRFPRRAGQLAGEWTPRYMYDVWAPRLLHRAAPDAKLLVLLRDPVERYRSGFAHQAIKAPKLREQLRFADALDRGRYAEQIGRLLEYFERDRILVLQYERCRREPAAEYARTLRFLGVADDFVPQGFTTVAGTTMASTKQPLWPDLERALRVALEPDVRALPALVDDLELDLWPNFAHLAAPAGTTAA